MASAAAMAGQETARYTRVAILLHWLIALLVALNLFLGFYYASFGEAARSWMMFFHKSIGLSVLALTLARLGWRIGHRPPPFDPVMKGWERGLAHLIHWSFYAALIALPLTGWMASSANDRPTDFFGIVTIPPLPVSRSEDAHDRFEEAHELLGLVTIGLILLHTAGALKHHFEGHRHLIGRMAPLLYRRR